MNNPLLTVPLHEISVDDRLQLVEEIWDSIAEDSQGVQLNAEQIAELDRRVEKHGENPTEGSTWEEVKARIQAKS